MLAGVVIIMENQVEKICLLTFGKKIPRIGQFHTCQAHRDNVLNFKRQGVLKVSRTGFVVLLSKARIEFQILGLCNAFDGI